MRSRQTKPAALSGLPDLTACSLESPERMAKSIAVKANSLCTRITQRRPPVDPMQEFEELKRAVPQFDPATPPIKVLETLQGAMAADLVRGSGFALTRAITKHYQIPKSELQQQRNKVEIGAAFYGIDSRPLQVAVPCDFDPTLNELRDAAALSFARILAGEKRAPGRALAYLEKFEIVESRICRDAFYNCLETRDNKTACQLLARYPEVLGEVENIEWSSKFKSNLRRRLYSEKGLTPKVGEYQEAVTVGKSLGIGSEELNAMALAAFKERLRWREYSVADKIATEYQICEEAVQTAVRGKLPQMFFQGKFHSALGIARRYELIGEIASLPDFEERAARFVCRKLSRKDWIEGLGELKDSGLLTEAVLSNPKVQEAAYTLYNSTSKERELVYLMSTFCLQRAQILPRVIPKITTMIKNGNVTQAARVMKWNEITPLTPGFEKISETIKQQLSRSCELLRFKLAETYCKHLGIPLSDLQAEARKRFATFTRNGNINFASATSNWLQVETATLFGDLSPEDAKLGFARVTRRGFSDFAASLLENCCVPAEEMIATLSDEDIRACVGSAIRANRWDEVTRAQIAFELEDSQVRDIAVAQIPYYLEQGDPRQVVTLLERYSIPEKSFDDISLQATFKAYQAADLWRVDAIVESVPSVASFARSEAGTKLVQDEFLRRVESKWSGAIEDHLVKTLSVELSELTSLCDAVRTGAAKEIERGNPLFAVELIEQYQYPGKMFLELMCEASEETLERARTQAVELHKSKRTWLGQMVRSLKKEDDARAWSAIRERIKARERGTPFVIGATWGITEDEVDIMVAAFACEEFAKGESQAASELMSYYQVARHIRVKDMVENWSHWVEKFAENPAVYDPLLSARNAEQLAKVFKEEAARVAVTIDEKPLPIEATPAEETGGNSKRVTREALARAIAADAKTVHALTPTLFVRQKTDHTCGPAAALCALHSALGVQRLEPDLVRILGTTPKLGTPLNCFNKLREEFPQTEILVASEGSIEHIKELLRNGYSIIANYHLGDEPHYGVIKAVGEQGVVLSDPISGPNTGLTFDQFAWHGGYDITRTTGGYVAIRDSGAVCASEK